MSVLAEIAPRIARAHAEAMRERVHPKYEWLRIGAKVWFNYPDSPLGDDPEYEVVGFVPEGESRAGQPVLRLLVDDEPGMFTGRGRKAGALCAIAPQFLLPMPYMTAHHATDDEREQWWSTYGPWAQGMADGPIPTKTHESGSDQ